MYLAGRSIAGIEKISFHASGSWSRSFVNDEAAAPFVSQGDSRHWEIWQRPDLFAPGWTKAYALEVPHTDLRTWPLIHKLSGEASDR